ncbi:MAG: hypothetical protein PUG07_02115, partial [Ruminococcus sp.]|nr:hypothetical protein [Ruminococcus sp.]
ALESRRHTGKRKKISRNHKHKIPEQCQKKMILFWYFLDKVRVEEYTITIKQEKEEQQIGNLF